MARTAHFMVSILLLGAARLALAQGPSVPPVKVDYGEISKLIHGMAVKEAPTQVIDTSEWGKTIPVPERLRLPGLKRTFVKVGDHVEVPHGLWKKARIWLDDPARDIGVTVTEIKPLEGSTYRVSLVGTADLKGEREYQQWVNGLALIGVTARATAKVQVDIDADVKLSLNILKLPPEVTVEPKIVRNQFEIKEFELFKPGGIIGDVQQAQNLNGELRNILQGMIRAQEPKVLEEANKAIAEALRQGKGTFSASALYEKIGKSK